VNLALTFHPNQ